jgi:type I restriction enzyme S subunit
MPAALAQPKAFAVWFKELERWSVSSFFRIRWKWPATAIRPLADALEPKSAAIDRSRFPLDQLQLVTLHFDGEMEPRDMQGKASFKGKLFFAEPGEVIYSKIDVRNGAIGVVPSSLPKIAVSSEYPVYDVRTAVALPEYVKLLFRTSTFRQQINSMISGASGRKRVQPSELEEVKVPFPPLPIQKVIVAHWRRAQEAAAKSWDTVAALEAEIPLEIYRALGTPRPNADSSLPKLLVLWWNQLERWSFNYIARARKGLLGFARSRYPIRPLGEHLLDTMNGYCIKPVQMQTPHRMLKLSALTPARLDVREAKFVKVSDRIAQRFHIRKGDLLICRSVGSYGYIAKCALVGENRPDVLFPDIIIRARFAETMLPEFTREVIQTPLGRSYFQSNARTAVGMWKIGAEDIRNFPIPVPPMEVQREIVDTVSRQRARIAEERKAAEARRAQAAREVEEMILGVRPVG